MRALLFFMLTMVMVVSPPGLLAQPAPEPRPEVDQAEIMRIGDVVQTTTGAGIRSDAIAAFVDAMRPPQDDSGKWFISVVTTAGCSGCQQLKRDWESSPWLLALANPKDSKESWAHYRTYDYRDQSQAFRWQNVRITAFPTIIVQPPRSEAYGKASTVVYEGVYRGDPEKQAREITTAIRRYIGALPNVGSLAELSREDEPPAEQQGEFRQGQLLPPWDPAPRVDPWAPERQPVLPRIDPLIPPLPEGPLSWFQFPWKTVLLALAAVFLAPIVFSLGVVVATFLRELGQTIRQRTPTVDRESLDRVMEKLADQLPAKRSPGRPRSRATARKRG